jgi:hypothetical protein
VLEQIELRQFRSDLAGDTDIDVVASCGTQFPAAPAVHTGGRDELLHRCALESCAKRLRRRLGGMATGDFNRDAAANLAATNRNDEHSRCISRRTSVDAVWSRT